MGFVGVVLLFADAAPRNGQTHPVAMAVALLGAMAWSVGTFYTSNEGMSSDPILSAGMQMLVGGGMLAIIAGLAGELGGLDVTRTSWEAGIALFYLAVPNALTFGLFVWLLRVASPILVSAYAYISPVVALFLGWALLDESLSWNIGGGATLVLAAVFILVTPPRWGLQRLTGFSPAPVVRRLSRGLKSTRRPGA
jgi:drug/metabolite transporter (DMT)-like permease